MHISGVANFFQQIRNGTLKAKKKNITAFTHKLYVDFCDNIFFGKRRDHIIGTLSGAVEEGEGVLHFRVGLLSR